METAAEKRAALIQLSVEALQDVPVESWTAWDGGPDLYALASAVVSALECLEGVERWKKE